MAIIKYPNPILKKISTPVGTLNKIIFSISNILINELEKNNAIGLSAVQVGHLVRMIVITVKNKPIVLINPYITNKVGRKIVIESCLSIPDETYSVRRPERLRLWGTTLEGKKIKIKCTGLLASVAEHEVDHLDGILIIDKGDLLDRTRFETL